MRSTESKAEGFLNEEQKEDIERTIEYLADATPDEF